LVVVFGVEIHPEVRLRRFDELGAGHLLHERDGGGHVILLALPQLLYLQEPLGPHLHTIKTSTALLTTPKTIINQTCTRRDARGDRFAYAVALEREGGLAGARPGGGRERGAAAAVPVAVVVVPAALVDGHLLLLEHGPLRLGDGGAAEREEQPRVGSQRGYG
jgi:hypothetical protein